MGISRDAETFDSPGEAALAQWSPSAEARVIAVDVRGDRAEVLLHVGTTDYPDYVDCWRTPEGWIGGSSGNGHVVLWDDD